jgi:RsiW-degrading membrane proteinase PrsW (M82 family)
MIAIILLFVMAFLPPIIYAIWIRNTEKYNREKWKPIILCFIWGATIAVIAAIILELTFEVFAIVLFEGDPTLLMIITATIIAPFAEEITKPLALALKTVKKELVEPEDGLIYGAVAGLGFSATENLFYGANAYITEGVLYFLLLISLRSFSSCLLHASATAWTGYGYGNFVRGKTRFIKVIPYLLLAILVHGFYNYLPTMGMLTGLSIAFVGALAFAVISIFVVRKKIITLDLANP